MPRPARSLLLPLFVAALAAPALTQPVAYSPALSAAENAAWRQYTDATERRIAGELATAAGFLALDFGASAAADRQAVLSGLMPVADMQTTQADGRAIEVPGRWVHHWRGAVLLPGVRLDHVLTRLQAEVPGTGKDDVLASAILGRNGPRLRVFMKVKRTKFITVVYNTEHLVTFHRRTPTRGSSTSLATKIAQLADEGTAAEREVGSGYDFLLRWNSYWRYEETPAGVIAECESISLSRSAPFGTGLVVAPIVSSTARESMERALVNLRAHFQTPPASSPAR